MNSQGNRTGTQGPSWCVAWPDADQAAPVLTLSGERRNNRYRVLVGAVPVDLSASLLSALVSLIVGRRRGGTGFVPESPVTITRLRAALRAALGPEGGAALIETGCGEEYRLAIPREQLEARLWVDPSFAELERLNLLSRDDFEHLNGSRRASENGLKSA